MQTPPALQTSHLDAALCVERHAVGARRREYERARRRGQHLDLHRVLALPPRRQRHVRPRERVGLRVVHGLREGLVAVLVGTGNLGADTRLDVGDVGRQLDHEPRALEGRGGLRARDCVCVCEEGVKGNHAL